MNVKNIKIKNKQSNTNNKIIKNNEQGNKNNKHKNKQFEKRTH